MVEGASAEALALLKSLAISISDCIDGHELNLCANALIEVLLFVSLSITKEHRCENHPNGFAPGVDDAEEMVSIFLSISKMLSLTYPAVHAKWRAAHAMH